MAERAGGLRGLGDVNGGGDGKGDDGGDGGGNHLNCGDMGLGVAGVLGNCCGRSCSLSSFMSFVASVYSVLRLISRFSIMVCKRIGLALPSISVLRRLMDIRGEDAQQDVEPLLPRCGCLSHNGVLGEPTGPIYRRFGKFRPCPPRGEREIQNQPWKVQRGRLACATRTDLVVRIFEGLGTLPGRGARHIIRKPNGSTNSRVHISTRVVLSVAGQTRMSALVLSCTSRRGMSPGDERQGPWGEERRLLYQSARLITVSKSVISAVPWLNR